MKVRKRINVVLDYMPLRRLKRTDQLKVEKLVHHVHPNYVTLIISLRMGKMVAQRRE